MAILRNFIAAVALASIIGPATSAEADPTCLTSAEAREALGHSGLAQPAAAQREAAARTHAEPLRNRLCRWNNELVYEITLLRPDGKITHVFVQARDGSIVKPPGE